MFRAHLGYGLVRFPAQVCQSRDDGRDHHGQDHARRDGGQYAQLRHHPLQAEVEADHADGANGVAAHDGGEFLPSALDMGEHGQWPRDDGDGRQVATDDGAQPLCAGGDQQEQQGGGEHPHRDDPAGQRNRLCRALAGR